MQDFPKRRCLESTLILNKKKFYEIADDFLKFIEGKKLVIHNAEFDISHINNELSLIKKNNIYLVSVKYKQAY